MTPGEPIPSRAAAPYQHPTGFHLSERALRREIETDRRAERWLWARAGVALLVIAAIVTVKVLWFP